ncbi:MAG: hypothetical protein WA810_05280 [Maribacter sp.]
MNPFFRLALCGCFLTGLGINAQVASPETPLPQAVEDDQPMMYQFEPNYVSAREVHREALLEKIKALDTLPISDKKRLRLIKSLYKDLNSEKFQKTIMANTQFEDEH